jgi:hypothetical protein
MSERFANELEHDLAAYLKPVRAPESLWYRVDREITAPRASQSRPLPRLAFVFSLLVVAAASAGWYFERPVSAVQQVPATRGQHTCIACHT